MNKTVFLHAGPSKSASSTIQEFFYANKVLLAEAGIFFPCNDFSKILSNNHSLTFTGAFSTNKEYQLKAKHGFNNSSQNPKKSLEEINRALDTAPKHVLFSGEDICTLAPPEVSEMVSLFRDHGYGVKVICFARAPVSYANSFAQQMIRGRRFTIFDILINTPIPCYRIWFEKFIQRSDIDTKVHKFTFSEGVENTPLMLLLSELPFSLTLHESALSFNKRVARSLSLEALLLLSALYEYEKTLEISSDTFDDIKKSVYKMKGTKFSLPKNKLDLVKLACYQDLEWLNLTFGIKF